MRKVFKLFFMSFLLMTLTVCGGGDDNDDSGDDASGGYEAGESPGSCFYECNLAGGVTQFGCTTRAADDDACYEVGRVPCGANIGRTALLASCDGCDVSCAPDWYRE